MASLTIKHWGPLFSGFAEDTEDDGFFPTGTPLFGESTGNISWFPGAAKRKSRLFVELNPCLASNVKQTCCRWIYNVSCQWKMQHVIPEGAVLLHTDQTPVLWSGTPFWCLHMTKTQNMEKYGWYLSTLLDIPLPSTALCLSLFSAGWHRRVGLVLSVIFLSFKELETPVSLHCEFYKGTLRWFGPSMMNFCWLRHHWVFNSVVLSMGCATADRFVWWSGGQSVTLVRRAARSVAWDEKLCYKPWWGVDQNY